MRRLHLKLFFLRTRYKREPQGVTAKTLGVRPATMSHLEQGRSLPTLPMLMALCKHYDVSPNYLLDDERGIEPQSRDRLSESDALIHFVDLFPTVAALAEVEWREACDAAKWLLRLRARFSGRSR